jgi:hypothetical protein
MFDVPAMVTNSTILSCCDYYQRTVGYVFTECDSGIGAIILEKKESGSTS